MAQSPGGLWYVNGVPERQEYSVATNYQYTEPTPNDIFPAADYPGLSRRSASSPQLFYDTALIPQDRLRLYQNPVDHLLPTIPREWEVDTTRPVTGQIMDGLPWDRPTHDYAIWTENLNTSASGMYNYQPRLHPSTMVQFDRENAANAAYRWPMDIPSTSHHADTPKYINQEQSDEITAALRQPDLHPATLVQFDRTQSADAAYRWPMDIPSTSDDADTPKHIKKEQSDEIIVKFRQLSLAKTSQLPCQILIERAMRSAPDYTMTVSEIYDWFKKNTTRAEDSATSGGWKDTIRSTLTMNGAFQNVKMKIDGKQVSIGWVLEPFAVKHGVLPTRRYAIYPRNLPIRTRPTPQCESEPLRRSRRLAEHSRKQI